MPDDASPDPTAFLSGIDVDSRLAAVQAGAAADDTVTNLTFVACVLYSGRPWQTFQFAAPSPDAGALTMDQFVQKLNATLVAAGYPPNLTWTSGACS